MIALKRLPLLSLRFRVPLFGRRSCPIRVKVSHGTWLATSCRGVAAFLSKSCICRNVGRCVGGRGADQARAEAGAWQLAEAGAGWGAVAGAGIGGDAAAGAGSGVNASEGVGEGGCGGGHEFAGAIGFDLELAIWRLAADAGSEAGIWQLMGARGGCGVCSSLTFDCLSEALVLGGSRCLAIPGALRSLVLCGFRRLAIPGALRLPVPCDPWCLAASDTLSCRKRGGEVD